MNNYRVILKKLEKELIRYSKLYPQKYVWSLETYNNTNNRYRSDLEIITSILRQGRILDVGAAPYHLTYILKKMGFEILGIDVNPGYYKEFLTENGLSIKKCDIQKEKIPFDNQEFDLIIFNEVFEHLGSNPIYVLKEINRVLKKGGYLLFTTPNLYAFHRIIMYLSGRSFNNALNEFIILEKIGYMGHIRLYSTAEIKQILTYSGFKPIKSMYKVHNKFSEHPYLQKKYLKILTYLLDLFLLLIPPLRPYQIILAVK